MTGSTFSDLPDRTQIATWVMDYLEEKFDLQPKYFTKSDSERYRLCGEIVTTYAKGREPRPDIINYFETQESLPYG